MTGGPPPPSWHRFLAASGVAAFALNWIWEMGQGGAYADLADLPWRQKLVRCTIASLGDVTTTLAIYGTGALAAGRLSWGLSGKWNVFATGALLGVVSALAIEWRALALDLWSYNQRMPVVPIARVGLWPLAQLTLLVPASFWIATHWVNTAPLARRSSCR